MITLITGEPGAGKTAYVVDLLTKYGEGVPIYVMGIPELQIPHEVVPQISEWTVSEPVEEDSSLYQDRFVFPDGSLVVIDEAQKVYRNRSTASRVPPYVSAFETHRHYGLNFILITQHPGLIDGHVRKLVGRHVHITCNWAGRKLYEWSQCGEPRDRTSVGESVVRRYKLPSRVFGLYKSSTRHMKVKRRIPVSALVFGILLIIAPLLTLYGYNRINTHLKEPDVVPGLERSNITNQSKDYIEVNTKPMSMSEQFTPRINTRPETAPLYDPIRKVSSMPVVIGCIQNDKRCKCYTDQATDTYLTDAQCKEWLKNPPYNPWRVLETRLNDREAKEAGERSARAGILSGSDISRGNNRS